MHLKKLFIRDFGIYNNAALEDIAPGIVVIGGKNRSGKSTFLKLLRCFAYGFEKSSDMPLPKVEYEVEGEIIEEETCALDVRLKGFGKPVITNINNKLDSYSGNLYGEVDSFAYKELFTISLDELQNLEKEEEKLQAVLLGAGLKDIIKIPKMVAAFKKEAEKIGGKSGNSKIKLFKPISSSISEAVEIKENMSKQIGVYESNIKKLVAIEKNIEQYQLENAEIENNIFMLEVLINNYDLYRELKETQLEIEVESEKSIYEHYKDNKLSLEYLKELKVEYKSLLGQYDSVKLDFQKNIGDTSTNLDSFNNNADNIKNAQLSMVGIKEKIKNYNSILESSKKIKLDLSSELMDINGEAQEDFSQILKINTEEIHFSQLCEDIDNFNIGKQQAEEVKTKIDSLQGEKNVLEEEVKNTPLEQAKSLKLYFIAALSFIVLGFVLYVFNKNFGIAVSAVGIGGFLLYTFIKINLSKENSAYLLSKKSALKSVKIELSALEDKLDKLAADNDQLNNKLVTYKTKLQLRSSVSVNSLKDYFRMVRELKKRVLELKYNLDKLTVLEADINVEIHELYSLAYSFKAIIDFDELKVRRNLIGSSDYLFKVISELKVKLDYYEAYIKVNNLKVNLEQKICTMIGCEHEDILYNLEKTIDEIVIYKNYSEKRNKYSNLEIQLLHALKSEKVQQVLMDKNEDIDKLRNFEVNIKEQLLQTFENNIEKYSTIEEIKEERKAIKSKFEGNISILEKLKEERANIKSENETIYNNDSLNYAQQKIESGRRELKTLAEKYAAYNAAAFILETVQKNFIEKTKFSLLSGAESILSEITGGEYVSILPPEDLTKCDFATTEKNGTVKESAAILSRGTKEQLFLAVRLSRIKEIKQKLPIIIDDSLVNFDTKHLKNVISVLNKLSKENQIFILTCHPEVVDFVLQEADKAQFYKLEAGSFSKAKAQQLSRYLAT